MENNIPMVADRVDAIDVHDGWTWTHRGYEFKNEFMNCTRRFVPPAASRCACLDIVTHPPPGSVR